MTTNRVLVAVLLVVAICATGCGGGKGDYELKMRVSDAAGLRSHQDVKIDGVRAGTVTAVDLGKGDQAEITMRLEPGAAPVGRGATGRIRSVSVLGEKYVDLTPDRNGTPMPSGSWLPTGSQPVPVELVDVLNSLDASTQARLRMLLVEGGIALTGRGADVADLLRVLPRGMGQVGQLIDDASKDNASLERVVSAGDRVISDLSSNRAALGRLVGSASAAFTSTAERRQELGAAVAEAPATLSQLRESLGRLQTTAGSLAPAADRLAATSPALTRALASLPGFADAAVPTLNAARATAPDLSRVATAATPTVKRLRPVAAKGADTLEHAYPLIRDLDRGLANDALYFLQTWARVTQRADGLGHLFGAQIVVGDDTVRMITDRVASNLAGAQKNNKQAPKQAPKPSTPTPQAQPKPAPQKLTPAVIEKLCQTVDKLAPAVTKALQKVTGKDKPCAAAKPGSGADQPPASLGDTLKGLLDRVTSPQKQAPEASAQQTQNGESQTVAALVDYLFGS
jgi:phospholipid/cholesterol/gamma-HCH transport system substrate-binding protein